MYCLCSIQVKRKESHKQLEKQQSGWFTGWWGKSKVEEESTKATLSTLSKNFLLTSVKNHITLHFNKDHRKPFHTRKSYHNI